MLRRQQRRARRRSVMISDKIKPHHLERKAILYVRQSSAHQVLHNRESSALQYDMRDRLTALGWSEIEVIDDDLGRRRSAGCCALALSGWWPRFASARLARSAPARSFALPATAGIGSNSSRCAAWSIPFWSIRKPFMRRVMATIASSLG